MASDTLQVGSVRTRSSSSYVTDSAASATAYSCGIKTYNGALGIDTDGNPCGTVLEAAKAAGYNTGMVVKSPVTDATPAAFASHIYDRQEQGKIALQLVGETPLGRTVDVLMGGGLEFFVPRNSSGSQRNDELNLLRMAENNGFKTVIRDRKGFDALKKGKSQSAGLPYLGLFASDRMEYAVERNSTEQPTLLEMAQTAIYSLERMSHGKDNGFFIVSASKNGHYMGSDGEVSQLIEASLIDDAAHAQDLVSHLQ